MHAAQTFQLVVGMIFAILALHWLAERLNWPPSIAVLIGGGALAFLPGIPVVDLDPELVLILFLPPLLMEGAWNTALVRFRRHFIGILSLAVGAVVFTTLVVASVAHWLMPDLPWAACAALGAIVAPPDAVSARAVLQRVQLPRRLSTLLEGESLLNDATGLVIFRFAVATALGADFSVGVAVGQFAVLAVGGALVGLAVGTVWVAVARRLQEDLLLIVAVAAVSWVSYLLGEALHVSGVIATVTTGLVLGWHQHELFSAGARIKGSSFWQVLIFLLEATVFMLIGLSLRGVLERAGGFGVVLEQMALPLLAIIGALTLARFVWIFGCDALLKLFSRIGIVRDAPLGRAAGGVMGWAGMRGVVTLAVALSLPDAMPGRDFMLVAAFAVILVTVVVQGSTLALVIRWSGVRRTPDDETPMGVFAAERAIAKAQLAAVEQHAHDADGSVIHPRLLNRYTHRASMTEAFDGTAQELAGAVGAHFDIVLAAVHAGRVELVRLHRAHQIDDETLQSLERDLDLEEMAAISAKT